MTTVQGATLKKTLESMFEHIANKQDVAEELQQLEDLHQKVALTTPPMLNHYLKRRSYTKALEFLNQGFVVEVPERPECDH